jgi:hypothetical protein
MPEFTYEESDNYILAQMAKNMSDGKLKRIYFDTLRGIREAGMNTATRLWIDILKTNLETRGLMVDGRVINKKLKEFVRDD